MKVKLSTSTQRTLFIKQARKSVREGKSIDILCIAGTAPLTTRLLWLNESAESLKHFANNQPIKVKITSVEASVYQADSDKATVNHNSQIDPNQEDQLEHAKHKLREQGVGIDHYSLCSEINGTKITRSSSASVSLDNNHQTKEETALQQRFPRETSTQIGKHGTTVRVLPGTLYGQPGQIPSRSTFCHDHKAFFLHQNTDALKKRGLLELKSRLGIPTTKGRIYFDITGIDDIDEFESTCRQQLHDLGHAVLDNPASSDTRLTIFPDQIRTFNHLYLDFLKTDNSKLDNGITVISDMGHGYIDAVSPATTVQKLNDLDSDPCNPSKFQDSDDFMVFLELLKQQNPQHPINRVVSDDCLNMRAIHEISLALKHNAPVSINITTADNRPLPFANQDQNINDQIHTFAENASLRLARLAQDDARQTRYYNTYFSFYSLINTIGNEILQHTNRNHITANLRSLINTHQSCLNALSMHEKIKNASSAKGLSRTLFEQNKTLSHAWQRYQQQKTKRLQNKLFVGTNIVCCSAAYFMRDDPRIAAGIALTGFALASFFSGIAARCLSKPHHPENKNNAPQMKKCYNKDDSSPRERTLSK